LVSLGCDKNRVDGEVMIGTLRVAGFEVVSEPSAADVIIVNTCGFIKDAVQESLELVFELAAFKAQGKCRALVIVGCMAERYKDEIKKTIPEADLIIGVGEYDKIAQHIVGLIGETKRVDDLVESYRGQQTQGMARVSARADSELSHIAFVKIAEGCDNHCTYCTIPAIRGKYTSRPVEEILEECRILVGAGAKEIVLVAQDTALYGVDLYGAKKLPDLLYEIAETSGAQWIRLMYVYPEHVNAALITALADIPQVCKYIDMPIQHSEEKILKKMGRTGGKSELERLIRVLRDRVAGIAIRTTLMVGFPGETAEDFKGLLTFAREMKFDRLGVFPYSQEEGTPAALMDGQIKEETKFSRHARLMEQQQKIHFKAQEKYVGQVVRVLVDTAKNGGFTGRTQHDAYESDTVVHFTADENLQRGDFCNVKIIATDDYDLRGIYV
jgi:ribosomal protein S12 methylthiotransferase